METPRTCHGCTTISTTMRSSSLDGLISSGLVALNDQRRGLETSRLRQMTPAELREIARRLPALQAELRAVDRAAAAAASRPR